MKDNKIYGICAYFIIYSVIGFMIETIYALIVYHVVESRQSFLYGPFCAIYGLGAILMILTLKKYRNNNIKLFMGGILVGAIAEFSMSFLGEKLFGMRFWDYSDKMLNIDGRICLLYSCYWGLAAFILIKYVNPKIDELIDKIFNTETKMKIGKIIIISLIIFMILDCLITYTAINYFIVDSAHKFNLKLKDEEQVEAIYNYSQHRPIIKKFLSSIATTEKIMLIFPNTKTILEDGTQFKLHDLTPEVRNCYYRFK